MAKMPRLDLQLSRKPRATDPDLTAPSAGVNQPPVAPLTFGPNRFTIRVPSLATKLSLGQGDASDAVRFNKRPGVGTESGIVAQTDQHAHLHTFGTDLPEAKTIVRLGIPTTSIPSDGPEYKPNADTGIGCLNPPAFLVWNGYSMVTQGASYQESRNNHLIVSADAEVRVIAKTFVNIGTPGDVLIAADTKNTSEEMAQNQSDPNDPADYGINDEYFRERDLKDLAVEAKGLLEEVVEFVNMIRELVGLQMKPMVGVNSWEPPDFADVVEAIRAAKELIVEAQEIQEELAGESEPGGKVNVVGSMSVHVGAGEKLTLTSGKTARISAFQTASMNAGKDAVVHGNVSASVGGMRVSMSGLSSATVEGGSEGVRIKGEGGVSISSLDAPVCVTSGPSVQLNATEGGAYVVGAAEAFLGSGEAEGFGVQATGEAMFIGNFATVPAMDEPTFVPECGISLVPEEMLAVMGSTEMSLSEEGFELEALTVEVTAPEVTITGGMVYLG